MVLDTTKMQAKEKKSEVKAFGREGKKNDSEKRTKYGRGLHQKHASCLSSFLGINNMLQKMLKPTFTAFFFFSFYFS